MKKKKATASSSFLYFSASHLSGTGLLVHIWILLNITRKDSPDLKILHLMKLQHYLRRCTKIMHNKHTKFAHFDSENSRKYQTKVLSLFSYVFKTMSTTVGHFQERMTEEIHIIKDRKEMDRGEWRKKNKGKWMPRDNEEIKKPCPLPNSPTCSKNSRL